MSIFDDHSYYCNCACAYDDLDGVKTIEISITDPTGHYASYKEGTDLSEVVMDILEDLESQFVCNDQRQADLQEIEDIEAKHKEQPELRLAQKTLAKEVITFLHGEEEYNKALRISEALFSGNVKELSLDEIEDGFKDVPNFELSEELSLIDLLVNNNIASSRREAREFISAGSISINGDKYLDENEGITKDKAIDNKVLVIRRGKKKYFMGLFK